MKTNPHCENIQSLSLSEFLLELPKKAACAFLKFKKWYLSQGSNGYVPTLNMDNDKDG
jgi:hypothetical protein